MAQKKARKKALPWEYCECGCRGHCFNAGSKHFWSYDPLDGSGRIHLEVDSHRAYQNMKTFESATELDEYVWSLIEKERDTLKKQMDELDELLA